MDRMEHDEMEHDDSDQETGERAEEEEQAGIKYTSS